MNNQQANIGIVRGFLQEVVNGGNLDAFMGAAATGKHAVWNGVGMYRIADGKIAEATFVEDILDMLLQLGITQLPH